MKITRSLSLLALLFPAQAYLSSLHAQAVEVKHTEGSFHGFLTLRTLDGKLVATGDKIQSVQGDRVLSRLVFHYKDGSRDEDTAVFSQRGHFTLITDHHIQKGPAFAKWIDSTLNASTGEVTIRYREGDKKEEKVDTEHLNLSPDIANGMLFNILKNISPETPETKLSFVAATPKARLVKLSITPQGADTFTIGGTTRRADRYTVKIELGGIAGVVAPIIGKQPADLQFWISKGESPAFVKSEGPLYEGGPILRIELASPVWSHTRASK